MGQMPSPLAIAHVTPYPWEDEEHEVNAYVRGVAGELSRHGHRVLILAPSRSQERVRASRRALRAAHGRAGGSGSLLEGTDRGEPRVIAVGEALDVQIPNRPTQSPNHPRPARALPIDVARTIEELLGTVPLDLVHVHEPFAGWVGFGTSNAALRHSRALNVGSFHAPTERLLSTMLARRFVETFFGRLDARTASFPQTAQLMARHFPAEYTLVAPADGDSPDADGSGHPGRGGGHSSAGGSDGSSGRTWEQVADELEQLYTGLVARRRDPAGDPKLRRRLAGRPTIDVDLHMHTDHSHDCATPVEVLLATAAEQGLGAIAVTDHNEISGALEARARAAESESNPAHPVKVIVGEEVKTADEGEVIGLFIEERIPRGLTLSETVAEIRRQGGLVYVPHPFDRLHAVPDYEHLLPVLDDVDAIEVFNPRVAIGAFNEEAARFAAKYRIAAGAGSDSHVAQGLGSVRVRMRDFDGPQEFLQSLREAEIVTRPTSLLYVQALKFLQTRATPAPARRARRARRVRRATGGERKP
jgi:predicted metal-dependent phosphoesterase TrpH